MIHRLIIGCLLTAITISGCSTDIGEYQQVEKPFDIKEYFDGPITAWGIVQDYNNKVSRRFCVAIEGRWQDNDGTLVEKFYFDDGEVSFRTWYLSKQPDGSYTGKADDVDGVAIGKHKGFAFNLQYDLKLELDGDTYVVNMDDWMYQMDRHRVMNKTAMKKFGIQVAEITLFFDKQLPFRNCSSPYKVASYNL